jgi:hypothetical protein
MGRRRTWSMSPELESRRRGNFVQGSLPLSAMSTDQVEVARFFREVYDWDLLRPIPQ